MMRTFRYITCLNKTFSIFQEKKIPMFNKKKDQCSKTKQKCLNKRKIKGQNKEMDQYSTKKQTFEQKNQGWNKKNTNIQPMFDQRKFVGTKKSQRFEQKQQQKYNKQSRKFPQRQTLVEITDQAEF